MGSISDLVMLVDKSNICLFNKPAVVILIYFSNRQVDVS